MLFSSFLSEGQKQKDCFRVTGRNFWMNFRVLQIQCLSPLFSQKVLIYREYKCAKYKINTGSKTRGVKWCGTPLLIFKEYKGATRWVTFRIFALCKCKNTKVGCKKNHLQKHKIQQSQCSRDGWAAKGYLETLPCVNTCHRGGTPALKGSDPSRTTITYYGTLCLKPTITN